MIDPKDALTEQELDRLVELDAASQGDVAGGTATPATPTIKATAQGVLASAALRRQILCRLLRAPQGVNA